MIFHYHDTPIYYEEQGKGPPLLLIHGFLESSTMWRPFLPGLTKHKTVITLDLPGHGQSGWISKVHTMELMADVVNELLNHLNIGNLSIVGHSMGGYVSLAFAEVHSDKVDELVLLNSTPAADSKERKRNRDRALDALSENAELFLGMAIGNLFSPENRKRYSEEILRLKKEALTFPLAGIKAAMRGMKERKDRTDVLAGLKSRKVMISAKNDPVIPFSTSKQLAIRCKTPLKEVQGGHMSHVEAFNEIVNLLHFIE